MSWRLQRSSSSSSRRHGRGTTTASLTTSDPGHAAAAIESFDARLVIVPLRRHPERRGRVRGERGGRCHRERGHLPPALLRRPRRGRPARHRADRGTRRRMTHSTVIRCGYGLFSEVGYLLDRGQPPEHAQRRRSTCTSSSCGAGSLTAGRGVRRDPAGARGMRTSRVPHARRRLPGHAAPQARRDAARLPPPRHGRQRARRLAGRRSVRQLLRNWLAASRCRSCTPAARRPVDPVRAATPRSRATCARRSSWCPFADGRRVAASTARRTRGERCRTASARRAPSSGRFDRTGLRGGRPRHRRVVRRRTRARRSATAVAEVTGERDTRRADALALPRRGLRRQARRGRASTTTRPSGYNDADRLQGGHGAGVPPARPRSVCSSCRCIIQDTALLYPAGCICASATPLRLCEAVMDTTRDLGGVADALVARAKPRARAPVGPRVRASCSRCSGTEAPRS